MKGFSLALWALVALEASDRASAFLPPNLLRPPHAASFRATSVDMATESDISVPYDAAARLAYDEWCSTYGKKFDAARYQVFKENYEAITVMNVSAKKAARDSGDQNPPPLLALNEYADYTAEEYEAAMSGGTSSPSTGDVLGQVADAVESQSAASNALQEAADALAEEEERLAAQLGLGSVEELEAAIDSMDGIAPDGGALEGDNLAREARVRSAYLDWCKEYKKEPDEARFQQFSINFLDMEEFAKESGKEMALNEYADCTEDEYVALMEGEAAVKEAESAIQAADDEMNAKAKAAETAAAAEAAAKKKAAEEAEAKKKAEQAEAKKKAEQEAAAAAAKKAEEEAKKKAEELRKKKAAEEEKLKLLAEKARLASLSEEERRKEIEKEKSARQAAQDKELENERLAAAAAAIAAAKAAQEAEAARIAKQRAIAEEAAEKLRAQARDWEAKQARLAPKPKVETPVVPPKKKTVAPTFSLGSLFGSQDSATPKVSNVPPPKAKEAAKTPAPRPTLSLGSFFDPSETKPAASKPVAKTPAKTPTPAKTLAPATKAPAPRPTLSLDFLTKAAAAPKPAPKPTPVAPPKPAVAAKAPAPAPAPKAAPRPSLGLNFFSAPAPAKAPAPAPKPEPQVELKLKPVPKIDTSDPVTEAFSSFFGGKKESAPKPAPKVQSAVAPKPAPVAKPAPTPVKASTPQPASSGFSFFSPKPAPKSEPAPAPVPAPAPKPAPAFSFFSPKPAPKVEPAPAPAPAPAPKPAAGFSFFSPKPAPKPEPVPEPTPVPTPKPAFSLFGGAKPAAAPKAAAKVAPVTKAAPVKTQPPARPTLSLFSAPKSTTASAAKAAPVAKTAAKSVAPQDNIPVLSRWVQNDDGSITGLVSNSPNFRNGTKITTSPVRKGAKGGSVVRTGSGSQYRLS